MIKHPPDPLVLLEELHIASVSGSIIIDSIDLYIAQHIPLLV